MRRGLSKAFKAKREGGFLLMEVLIAFLIISIGIAALVNLQVIALRYSKLIQQRATAAMLAGDIAERMKVNPKAWADQADVLSAQDAPDCLGFDKACSPQQIAQSDLHQWRNLVRIQLPDGAGQLQISDSKAEADIWLIWSDRADVTAECADILNLAESLGKRCFHLRASL